MPIASLFTKIDHVGIAVPDLDAAIAFYADTFGIVSVHEETNEEQGVREAMLAVGDGTTRIQLLAPLNDDSTIAKFIDRNGPGRAAAGLHRRRHRGQSRPTCAARDCG